MDESALALILKNCLDGDDEYAALRALANLHPSVRDEIAPLLEVADQLRQPPADPPVPEQFLRNLGERLRNA